MNRLSIDDALLRADGLTPTTADGFSSYRLAGRLGGLARWLLRDEVLEKAAVHCETVLGNPPEAAHLRTPPRLPRRPGACGVLFAADAPGQYPLLREAFALPVRWEQAVGECSGTDVPPGLAAEAAGVLELLDPSRDGGEVSGGWRLRLAADAYPERYDLSGWGEAGGGSAWGILAAALLTARFGVPTDPTVWASVGWDAEHRRFRPVTGLGSKLAAARHFGASVVFVAPGQADGPAGGVDVRRLADRNGRPAASLAPLQVVLAVRPHPLADYLAGGGDTGEAHDGFFNDANAYHRLLTALGERDRASAYYRDELIGPIADRCRRQLPRDWPVRPRLVTFISGTPELAELAARVHHPGRALLLHTRETAAQLEHEAGRVRAAAGEGCDVSFARVDSDVRPGCLPPEVSRFAAGGPPGELVLDLTPGTKAVTLAVYADLSTPGTRQVYVHTSRPDGSTIRYGTETIVILPPAQPAAGRV